MRILMWSLKLLLASLVLLPFSHCVEAPDPALEARYQETAHRFCNAVVECLKEDLEQRLQAEPRKRDLFLQRMDQDLCRQGQYEKIQGLQDRMKEGTILERYSDCSRRLEETKDCSERLAFLKSDPNCKSIRFSQEFP